MSKNSVVKLFYSCIIILLLIDDFFCNNLHEMFLFVGFLPKGGKYDSRSPSASGIIVRHLESRCINLGSVQECRDCAMDSAALRCCGVSCSQSNFDFAYCPDAIQKTDSEMSEEGEECKPEQTSIPL